MNIKYFLSEVFQQAFEAKGYKNVDVMLQVSQKFADYQVNGCMRIAKQYGIPPRDIAQLIIDWLQQSSYQSVFSKLEVAGPGFININLDERWLNTQITLQLNDRRCGVEQTSKVETIIVDYSSPNLAKEMHVGHLRSTIIGDAMVKILEFQGHHVIRQNHMGDWGTQFGMLIAQLKYLALDKELEGQQLADLEYFYRQAKQHFDEDEGFANTAREMVVALQAGEQQCLDLWKQFIHVSLDHAQQIYDQLDVSLNKNDVMPESAYNDQLEVIINDLTEAKLLLEDNGAKVVLLDEFKNREGESTAAIVQKSDGGYLYLSTDIACIKHRLLNLKGDRLLYFIDARQSLHMQQLFSIARKLGWLQSQQAHHYAFGTMMGADGKPFKTRSGEVVKLKDLLDESVQRAAYLVSSKNPELDNETCQTIARVVGIGAVKYADLSKTRTNDYIFDWDAILSFDGNTAPYLQYAYTRINSLIEKVLKFNKDNVQEQISLSAEQWLIEDDIEKQLRLKLLQFPELIEKISTNAYPHELCNYLYDIASLYMKFYEQCPVMNAADAIKTSRIGLCQLTSNVLKLGLSLLGIDVLQKM